MTLAVDILLTSLLAIVCLGGLVLTVLQLPGTWLIVVAAAGYDWYFGWSRIGLTALAVLFGIAAVAEVAELVTGSIMTRRSGASRRAAWYGLIGGMLGALLLSIPVPLFGTLVGAAAGCFAGAFLAEVQLGKGLHASTRAGTFSAIGRTLGGMLKLVAALLMAGIALVQAILGHWR